MQRIRYTKAFTLVELLVGLSIISILLTAIATLAFAMNSAGRVAGDTAFRQAQVRQATVRITELVGKCRLICAAPGNDLVIWSVDDKDNGDDRINLNELAYIERGTNRDMLRLCRFNSADNPQKSLSDLALAATKAQLIANYPTEYIPLIPDGTNVQFTLDVAPPRSELLAISFEVTESDTVNTYQIVTAVRCRAAHLVNDAGTALVAADDD